MPFPTSMHAISCAHRPLLTSDDPDTGGDLQQTFFGLVHDELLADVLTGYLNTMTQEDCPRLRGLANWEVRHRPVRVFTVGNEQDFADALVGKAFEWFQLGRAA